MNPSWELTAKLEAALVRELRAAYVQANESFFQGRLRSPTIELVASRTTLGRWVPRSRTLEISRPLVLEKPWVAVIEVLKHEMAHQYVEDILGEVGETAHGPAFRQACARLGIDARASGVPHVADATEERVVERIAKLLALAESPNRHEAEAAMAAAQRLMLKHNLDATSAVRSSRGHDHGYAHLGTPTGRVAEHERLVAMILGKHFFVEAIWVPVYRPLFGKRASVLEICGTRANLAIAQYVHGYLHDTAERLWATHKRDRGIRGNQERRTYLAGAMTGFADRLARQEAKSRSEGLVWVRDADLEDYFRSRHPHVRHIRHAGRRRSDAWDRGREAGRQITLVRPIPSPTAHAIGNRLLPAAKLKA